MFERVKKGTLNSLQSKEMFFQQLRRFNICSPVWYVFSYRPKGNCTQLYFS